MEDSVSLLDAINRWMAADSTLRDASLGGMKIVAWGRIGKLAAFLSGLVLVLDIIGPERLRAYSKKAAEKVRSKRQSFLMFAMPVLATNAFAFAQMQGWPIGLVILTVALTAILVFQENIAILAIRIYERDKLAQAARMIALVLFVGGFLLDMLAS